MANIDQLRNPYLEQNKTPENSNDDEKVLRVVFQTRRAKVQSILNLPSRDLTEGECEMLRNPSLAIPGEPNPNACPLGGI